MPHTEETRQEPGLLPFSGGQGRGCRRDGSHAVAQDIVSNLQKEGAVHAAREGDEAGTDVPEDSLQFSVAGFHRRYPA